MRIWDCIIYYLSISSGYITIDKDLTVDYNEYIITTMQKKKQYFKGDNHNGRSGQETKKI